MKRTKEIEVKELSEIIGDLDHKQGVATKKLKAFIRPTRRLHESGYRIFQCGYISTKEPHKIFVISEMSDHIFVNDDTLFSSLSLDCDEYGRIGIYRNFAWDGLTAYSTMEIESVKSSL